jgi:hypothetical protein
MEHPQPLGQRKKVTVEHDEQGTGIVWRTEPPMLFIRSSDRALDLISWLCEPRDGRLVETPMGTACGTALG